MSPGERAKRGSREKYIYQKFNRAAILFMRVYVCQGDEKRRKHLFAYIENSATLRDLAKRYYYTEDVPLSNKHQTASSLIK